MRIKNLLLFLLTVGFSSAQYKDLPINQGEFGSWLKKVYFPKDYYICGMELRNQDYQGVDGDDTGTNGIAVTLCSILDWSDQKKENVLEGLEGTWKGMKMCPEGTYVIGASVQYDYTLSQDDQSSINGLMVKCANIFTGANSSDLIVYEGPFGVFMPIVLARPMYGVCGAQVQNQIKTGGGDETALNSLLFLICQACSQACETCSGFSDKDCVICKLGQNLQPDGSCTKGCPQKYLDFKGVCLECDSSCDGCTGMGPAECIECAPGFQKDIDQGICKVERCSEGQFYSYPHCVDCLPSCEECDNVLTCSQCSEHFFLSPQRTSCLTSCEVNEWTNQATSTCHICSLHCQRCLSQSVCSECDSPFQLLDGVCVHPCELGSEACQTNQVTQVTYSSHKQKVESQDIDMFWSLLLVLLVYSQILIQGYWVWFFQSRDQNTREKRLTPRRDQFNFNNFETAQTTEREKLSSLSPRRMYSLPAERNTLSNQSPTLRSQFEALYLSEVFTLQLAGLSYYFHLPHSIPFFKYLNLLNGVFSFYDSDKFYLNSAVPLAFFLGACVIQALYLLKAIKAKRLSTRAWILLSVSSVLLQLTSLQLFSASGRTLLKVTSLASQNKVPSQLSLFLISLFYVAILAICIIWIIRICKQRKKSKQCNCSFQLVWLVVFALVAFLSSFFQDPFVQTGVPFSVMVGFAISFGIFLRLAHESHIKCLVRTLLSLFPPLMFLLPLIGHSAGSPICSWLSAVNSLLLTCLVSGILVQFISERKEELKPVFLKSDKEMRVSELLRSDSRKIGKKRRGQIQDGN